MSTPLSDEYRQVYDAALRFARSEFGPVASRIDRDDRFPDDLWQRLGAQGYLGAGVPEAYGGSGGDYLTAALIGQALARVSPAISLSYGAHLNLCVHNLLRNGSEAQKRAWLPKLCSGEWVGCLMITEPEHGSDALGMRLHAKRDGDRYLLSGTKTFITNAPVADFAIVYAKTTPEAGNRGLTAFCVELPREGVSVSKSFRKVGMRGSPTGEIAFDNVVVGADAVLGAVDEGLKIVMSGLDLERAFFATLAVGLTEECLELAQRYAEQRAQFGRPIAQYQLVQAKLADMFTGLYVNRLATYRTLRLAQQGERIALDAAATLLAVGEHAVRTAEETVQIHGGYGFTKEFAAERFWRDARLLTIGAGTSEIRRLIVARELFRQL